MPQVIDLLGVFLFFGLFSLTIPPLIPPRLFLRPHVFTRAVHVKKPSIFSLLTFLEGAGDGPKDLRPSA
jgi:hypothetical protein